MGKSKKKTTSKQEYRLPAYMRNASMDAVSRARAIADRPYEAYGGQRISDLSQNEQMGLREAREGFGAWEGDFASAREALGRVGSIADEGALEGYMNPYMEEVLNPQLRRRNEAFEAERAQRRATAGMRGAFGGRQDLYESKMLEGHQQGLDDLYGTAYGAAFDRATQMFGAEQDRLIRQAGAYQNLGMGEQQVRSQALRDLMSTGLTERTRDQADLDFQYLEHLEERDWDITNLDTLVRTLQSVPHEYTQYGEQTTTSSSSPLKTLAGIGALTAGAIMTGGASLAAGGSFWGGIGESLMGLGASSAGGEG